MAFIETSRVVSRWWTTIAGLLLILGGLLAAIYGGVLTGSAPWTAPFPIIGPAPVMPILLSALPAITGIGVIRRAGWARTREALVFGVATLGILVAGYVLLYLAAPHTELSNLATIAAGILPTSGLATVAFVAGQRRSTLDLLSIIGVFAAWVLAQWIIY